jgi:hypothetical protein
MIKKITVGTVAILDKNQVASIIMRNMNLDVNTSDLTSSISKYLRILIKDASKFSSRMKGVFALSIKRDILKKYPNLKEVFEMTDINKVRTFLENYEKHYIIISVPSIGCETGPSPQNNDKKVLNALQKDRKKGKCKKPQIFYKRRRRLKL